MGAVALLGVYAATTAYSAYEKHKEGQAAKQAGAATQAAADDQAQLSDFNAQVADLQARDALNRGEIDADRYRTQVRGVIASTRAATAGNNIDVGFGSAVDVQADEARLGELDALQIVTNAKREAWGYQVQAFNYRRQAAITRKEGANAAEAGRVAATNANIAAVGGALTSTSSLLMQKYGFGEKKS